jgi:hypothetical protein
MMTEPLFDTDVGAPLPAPLPLSTGRRLTARQRLDVAKGYHPLTRLPLLEPRDDTKKCGTCIHRTKGGSRGYPKCDQTTITSGPATDCRAWWPACTKWESA